MADNIKDLTLETATDEVKTDEAKTDEIETVSKEDAEVESVAATKSTLLGATANSTEDIPATSFTTKTAPDGTDNLILFNQNTNVGYQIDYDNLADAILNKITSKTFPSQVGSSAATILAQLATLNSNIESKFKKVVSVGAWFGDTAQAAFNEAYATWGERATYIGFIDCGSPASFICSKTNNNYGAVLFISYGGGVQGKRLYEGTWLTLRSVSTL